MYCYSYWLYEKSWKSEIYKFRKCLQKFKGEKIHLMQYSLFEYLTNVNLSLECKFNWWSQCEINVKIVQIGTTKLKLKILKANKLFRKFKWVILFERITSY